MVAVGEGGRAVLVLNQGIVGKLSALRQLDDVLRAKRPKDRVIAAVGAEVDSVRRQKPGNIDGLVVLRSLQRDGAVGEASRREIAMCDEAIAAAHSVDHDLLDVVQFGDDSAVADDHDLGVGSNGDTASSAAARV